MYLEKWLPCFLLILTTLTFSKAADDDYNILHRDGSFEFGYDNPNSYHHAAGNRNNVVRGEFGGRNPGTGRIDSTQYTAGPRGYRPRGKNIHRKFDLNQNGPRPVGSRDDPYFDPYEDPSYSFEFKTRTYNRQENANRAGNVNGRYNYIDDVGEIHNVEFVAGKNIGFHVKTPYPDSNPRAYYGRLFYRGRGKPIPRGRTSIQRGLDGSYRFVSAGPDQRRTETSDSSGHVRGSYTYLDDKGVQHSVHYIAGPETGYRVLKNVKGPHLPTVYPFGRPEIIPSDFYDYIKDDVFDTAASGPINNVGGGSRPNKEERPGPSSGGDFGSDLGKPEGDKETGGSGDDSFGAPSGIGTERPVGTRPPPGVSTKPPLGTGSKLPTRPPPGGDDYDSSVDGDDFEGELFGPFKPSKPRPARPQKPTTARPSDGSLYKPGLGDDGSYIPPGDVNQDDGSYKPGLDEAGFGIDSGNGGGSGSGIGGGAGEGESPRPGLGVTPTRPPRPPRPDTSYPDYEDSNGLFGSESNSRPPLNGRPPIIQIQDGTTGGPCERCQGTIVTNVGDRLFSVPPGVSVRAHVQSIDLLPLVPKVPSPSDQYKQEMGIKTEQLNSAASDLISNNSNVTVPVTETNKLTTTAMTTVDTSTEFIETTTVNE